VSPYLTEELRAGDQLEVRGPIGRWFVWDTTDGGPLLLIAGGSGIVPLRAILRHRQRSASDVPVHLLYSSRTVADVIYHRELDQFGNGVQVSYTLTRDQPPGWTGYSGRVNAAMLTEVAWPAGGDPLAFVCGPTNFVEAVAGNLVGLGYPPGRVKTERFGGA
jgi:ferredoxin-NADP reductase